MKISSQQVAMMREAMLRQFLSRMIEDLARDGCFIDEENARIRTEEAMSFGLVDEESVRMYVDCCLRLERRGFDVVKLQRVAGAADLDRDHKLIALRMLVDRIEGRSKKGEPYV
ncbi:hypothetical protein WMF27_46270 [Sorangium sp. So ce281]|uniref:hypothetical protein n=1 Tax=unclassified Sorangium TaxID=2621164 RepID=UPI003F62006B